jgi:hypothetical protein
MPVTRPNPRLKPAERKAGDPRNVNLERLGYRIPDHVR